MSAAPATAVFAFSAPVVKPGGELHIAAVVKAQAPPLVLSGSREAWHALFTQLAALFVTGPAAAGAARAQDQAQAALAPRHAAVTIRNDRGYSHPIAYERILAARAANPRLTYTRLAKAEGVQAHRFYSWDYYRRRRAKAGYALSPVAAPAGPVRKPNGKLL
jgi:hypothetical protein